MFAVGALVSRGVGDASSASTPAADTAGESGEKPKPSGMPAKLLSKVVETEGSDGSFAVYNLTFQVPNGASDLGVRIGYMDSIKVMVPVRPWRAAIACLNGCTHGVFEIIFPHLLRICPLKSPILVHTHALHPNHPPSMCTHTHSINTGARTEIVFNVCKAVSPDTHSNKASFKEVWFESCCTLRFNLVLTDTKLCTLYGTPLPAPVHLHLHLHTSRHFLQPWRV